MAEQGGYGVVVTIGGTAVANVEDVEFPKFSKYMAESTAHDSPSGYYEAVFTGKRRIEPITMKLVWDQANATHATDILASGFEGDPALLWSIAVPASNETIEFSAHLESLQRIAAQEGKMEADIVIHPSGTATIT